MFGGQSAATVAAAVARAKHRTETDALMAAQKRKASGVPEPSDKLGAVAAPNQGAGKKLVGRPTTSDPGPKLTSDRPKKKVKGPVKPSAEVPLGGTEDEDVEAVETKASPVRRPEGKGTGALGSKKTDRGPRGKRIPYFNAYFPPEYWTKSERADLEVNFTRFPTAPLIGEHLVLDEYRLLFLLDRVDSVHDDPNVCMMVLQNAYLPADRDVLKERDYGLLVSEMFMHFKKIQFIPGSCLPISSRVYSWASNACRPQT